MILLVLQIVFSGGGAWAGSPFFSGFCRAEMRREWEVEVVKNESWAREAVQDLEGLRKMARSTCPSYRDARNDPGALQAFLKDKGDFLDPAPGLEREGMRLLEFWETQIALHQEAFGTVDINFRASPCARKIMDNQKKMIGLLGELKRSTASIASACGENSDPPKENPAANGREESANGPAIPAGHYQASDISGTEGLKNPR